MQQGFLETLQSGLESYVELAGRMMHLTDDLRRRVLANDIDALIALWQQRIAEDVAFDDVLPSLTIPYMLIAGSADSVHVGVEEHSRNLRPGTLVTIDGADHTQCEERADLIVPHLEALFRSG